MTCYGIEDKGIATGYAIKKELGKVFCKNCGKEIGSGKNFCPYCGTNLQEDKVTATKDVEKGIVSLKKKYIISAIIGIAIIGGLVLGGLGVTKLITSNTSSSISTVENIESQNQVQDTVEQAEVSNEEGIKEAEQEAKDYTFEELTSSESPILGYWISEDGEMELYIGYDTLGSGEGLSIYEVESNRSELYCSGVDCYDITGNTNEVIFKTKNPDYQVVLNLNLVDNNTIQLLRQRPDDTSGDETTTHLQLKRRTQLDEQVLSQVVGKWKTVEGCTLEIINNGEVKYKYADNNTGEVKYQTQTGNTVDKSETMTIYAGDTLVFSIKNKIVFLDTRFAIGDTYTCRYDHRLTLDYITNELTGAAQEGGSYTTQAGKVGTQSGELVNVLIAYQEFLDKECAEHNEEPKLLMVDIDNNGMPEMVRAGKCDATAMTLCTYSNGKVEPLYVSHGGWGYIPNANTVEVSGAQCGDIWWYKYSINNGKWEMTDKAECDDMGTFHRINDRDVSAEEFQQHTRGDNSNIVYLDEEDYNCDPWNCTYVEEAYWQYIKSN